MGVLLIAAAALEDRRPARPARRFSVVRARELQAECLDCPECFQSGFAATIEESYRARRNGDRTVPSRFHKARARLRIARRTLNVNPRRWDKMSAGASGEAPSLGYPSEALAVGAGLGARAAAVSLPGAVRILPERLPLGSRHVRRPTPLGAGARHICVV